jgi:acyl-CoA synthetase (AMP-forming)/AMP-acid ligase II
MTPDDANFAATLSARARRHPGQAALVEPDPRARWRSISFSDLDALADRYANGLAHHGVRRGDRALYLLRPSIESFAVFYALLRIGAVPVFIDPRVGIRRLLACITSARAHVLLAVPSIHLLRLVAPRAFADATVRFTSGGRWPGGGVPLADCRGGTSGHARGPVALEDACFLPFTSGSTGAAKAVLCSHRMLRHQVSIAHEVCGWREGMHVVMGFAPFVPHALADGLTVILPDIDFSRPARARPERIIAAVNDHGAECAFASPVVWRNLARHCEEHGVTLPTLERGVTVGAPVPMALHRRLAAVLPSGGQLYTPYGATEAMPVSTAGSGELAATWQRTRSGYGTCVGRPLSGVDVRIIRVTDDPIATWEDALCVAAGEIGEIVVTGDLVSLAYPDRPDETARAKIGDGDRVRHRMGDLGRIDADGRLWFCGRKSQRIETRHGMIPPDAMENIFNEHPAVARTAVVGFGPPGAERVAVCVELAAGASFTRQLVAELVAQAKGTCFEGVASHFLPHRGFPVDARHNAKIRREVLAAWVADTLGESAATP